MRKATVLALSTLIIAVMIVPAVVAATVWNPPSAFESSTSWKNAGNAYVDDGNEAKAESAGQSVVYYGFGFGITPAESTIDGIQVQLDTRQAPPSGTGYFSVQLYDGSSWTSTTLTTGPLGSVYTLGSETEKWGGSWTTAKINSVNFKVKITSLGTTNNWFIDIVKVGVTYTAPSDTTPPVITPTISGTLGNNGWYVSDVTISWTITDPESTVTSTTGAETTIINYDTTGVTLTCSATSSGGTSSQSVTIKRDATKPSISASATPLPNANGWNNVDVIVTFAATDDTSGVASITSPVTVSTEGENQKATGTAVDNAGNSASVDAYVSIDKTKPEITMPTFPSTVYLNQPVSGEWTATDALSGVDGAASGTITVDTSTVGVKSGKVTVIDKAGNFQEQTWSTTVMYKFVGFLPPIGTAGHTDPKGRVSHNDM